MFKYLIVSEIFKDYKTFYVRNTHPGKEHWKNDGYCDDVNNNPAYDFDGGDCCKDESIEQGKEAWNPQNSDAGGCLECRCKTMKLDLKVSNFFKIFYYYVKNFYY